MAGELGPVTPPAQPLGGSRWGIVRPALGLSAVRTDQSRKSAAVYSDAWTARWRIKTLNSGEALLSTLPRISLSVEKNPVSLTA